MSMALSCCGSADTGTSVPSKRNENEEVKVAHIYTYR